MKIRNLLFLTMIMALTTLCVSAQQGAGDVTITDYLKQELTISRFGTVVSFKNKNGKLSKPGNTYKICTCEREPKCIDSDSDSEQVQSSLKGWISKPGKTLKKEKSLKVVVIVKLRRLKVTRRIEWLAGSTVVDLAETVVADRINVCSIEKRGMVLGDSCSMPPPSASDLALKKCPPPSAWKPLWLNKFAGSWKGHLERYSMDLARVPTVEP